MEIRPRRSQSPCVACSTPTSWSMPTRRTIPSGSEVPSIRSWHLLGWLGCAIDPGAAAVRLPCLAQATPAARAGSRTPELLPSLRTRAKLAVPDHQALQLLMVGHSIILRNENPGTRPGVSLSTPAPRRRAFKQGRAYLPTRLRVAPAASKPRPSRAKLPGSGTELVFGAVPNSSTHGPLKQMLSMPLL